MLSVFQSYHQRDYFCLHLTLLLQELMVFNGIERKESLAASNKNHVSLGPKLIEIVKHKLSYGAKMLPLGRKEKIFMKRFSNRDCENMLHTTRCKIYTTVQLVQLQAISLSQLKGLDFVVIDPSKHISFSGELLKFQYKVSIPLGKIKGVGESMNLKKPSNMYLELVTVDDFSFWFMGFPNYKKKLKNLNHTITSNFLRY